MTVIECIGELAFLRRTGEWMGVNGTQVTREGVAGDDDKVTWTQVLREVSE